MAPQIPASAAMAAADAARTLGNDDDLVLIGRISAYAVDGYQNEHMSDRERLEEIQHLLAGSRHAHLLDVKEATS